MQAFTLEDLFKGDDGALFDGGNIIEYKGFTIIDNRPVISTYTVRAPQGWIIYETSNKGTIQDCKDMIDSKLQWEKEAK